MVYSSDERWRHTGFAGRPKPSEAATWSGDGLALGPGKSEDIDEVPLTGE
jgi:hypothetical protein